MAKLTGKILVMIPDTRAVEPHPYGLGNTKIGFGVHTYSRLAGNPALGNVGGTCPGSSPECEAICYAKRIGGLARYMYEGNAGSDVPPIPAECQILRIHVSGDFDSIDYIASWYNRLKERPDVTAWAYTRSWRVPSLLAALEALRSLPNMQLFASMDESVPEMPPAGWRRAWIDGDTRAGEPVVMRAHSMEVISKRNFVTADGDRSFICPEETKHKQNCLTCGYCFEGRLHDVTFLRH